MDKSVENMAGEMKGVMKPFRGVCK
jgi:hypothetical protein